MMSVVLARYLTPTNFGLLSLLLAIVAMSAPVAALGFNAIITRELLAAKTQTNSILLTAFLFRLASSFVLTLCAAAVYFFEIKLFNLDEFAWALLALFIANMFSSFEIYSHYFLSRLLARTVVKFKLMVFVFFLILKLLLIYLEASFSLLLIVIAVELAFQYLANFFAYTLDGGEKQGRFDFIYGRHLLKESSWLILSGVAAVIYLKIDLVMLATLSAIEDVAVYSVAVKISEIWYFIPIAISASFFPKLLKLRESSRVEYYLKLQSLCDRLFFLGLFISVVVLTTAPIVIPFVFGDSYSQSVPILQVHIWACVFMFMRALFSKWILAEKLGYLSLASQGAGAVLNIALNLILIPLWQGFGAALATVFSYTAASYLILFCFKDSRPMAFIMTRSLFSPFLFFWRRIKSVVLVRF